MSNVSCLVSLFLRILVASQVWFADERILAKAARLSNEFALLVGNPQEVPNETVVWWNERVSCNPRFFPTQNGKMDYYRAVASSVKDATNNAKFADWLFVPSTIVTDEGLQLDELLWNKLKENAQFRVYIYTYELFAVNPVTGKWGPFHTGVSRALREFVADERSKNRVSIVFASGRDGKWEQYWSCHMKAVSIDDRELYLGGVEWMDERLANFQGVDDWQDLQAHIPGGKVVTQFTEVYESMWRTFCNNAATSSGSGSCDTATLEALREDRERREAIDRQLAVDPEGANESTYCSLELSGGEARIGPEIARGGLTSHMGERLVGGSHDHQAAIYHTYLKALRAADTVLIEDQYFSAGFSDRRPGQVVENTILSALDETKSAAIIIPLSSVAAIPTYRSMVQWKKRQWKKEYNVSLRTRGWFNGYLTQNLLKLDTLKTPNSEFFFLMNAQADDKGKYIKLDQKFVHSKALIALGGALKYPLAVVGSANINDRSLLGTRDAEISVRIEGDGVLDLFSEKIAWYLAVSDSWVRRVMHKCTQAQTSKCCQRVASSFLQDLSSSSFATASHGGVIQLLEKRGLRIDETARVADEGVVRSAYKRILNMTQRVGEAENLSQHVVEHFAHLLNRSWYQPNMLRIMSTLAMVNADLLSAVTGGEVDVVNKRWHSIGKSYKFKSVYHSIVSVFKPPQERRLLRGEENECFEPPVDALLLPFKLGLMTDMAVADFKLKAMGTLSVLQKDSDEEPMQD